MKNDNVRTSHYLKISMNLSQLFSENDLIQGFSIFFLKETLKKTNRVSKAPSKNLFFIN